jgi:glutaredoxin
MGFTVPNVSGFTVYGKTGCSYCDKVKTLLTEYEQEFTYINCDEYLLTDRDGFLEFIRTAAGKEYKTFPMVFSPKGFVGGYAETIRLILDS